MKKMKIIYKTFTGICLAVALVTEVSCNFLEREDDGKLQEDEVFTRFDKVNQLVTELYADMYINSMGLNMLASYNIGVLSDELEFNYADAGNAYKILNGQLSADPAAISSVYGGYLFGWWWTYYQSIRKANKILWGVRKYNTPDHPSRPGLLEKRIGEAYFFRAYYHYMILRFHGEMVYSDRVYDLSENPASYAVRESVHASVEKICDDLDEAARRLPVKQEGEEFNRIDKGACLAVKTLARWIVAQPLYNGGIVDSDGNHTGISPLGDIDDRIGLRDYMTYDTKRWVRVVEAAKEFMELVDQGRYSLFEEDGDEMLENSGDMVYKRLEQMFRRNTFFQKESILTLTNSKDTRWIQDNVPRSYGNGQTRNQPTQEQVDMYEVIDKGSNCGWDIYTAKKKGLYDDANPYVNRDPRFYRDVVYIGAILQGKQYDTSSGTDVLTNTSETDIRNTRTGYALRKFVHNDWTETTSITGMSFPLIRLPEIMLVYAEALNETGGDMPMMRSMLDQIRERSFMLPVQPEFDTDKKIRSECIERERRVELFFENNRYFSVRYKGIMTNPDELSKEEVYVSLGDQETRAQQWFDKYNIPYPQTQHFVHGMRPVRDEENGKIVIGNKRYRMERIESKQFDGPRKVGKRDYYFPINSNEIAKTPSLKQNPGW